MLTRVLFCLLLGLPALVVAQPAAQPSSRSVGQPSSELSHGLRLYNALDYAAAQPHLRRAYDDSGLSANDRALAGLYLGIVQLSLGDEASARSSFRGALELDRRLLAPRDSAPKIGKILESIRAELPPEPALEIRPASAGELDEEPPPPPPSLQDGEASEAQDGLLPKILFWGGVGLVAGAAVTAGVLIAACVYGPSN